MIDISASILTADFCELGRLVDTIEASSVNMLHFDVMDGHFVPNISFGIPVLESIRKRTKKTLDVHLMIENPEKYVELFAKAGADIITVHAESCKHLHRTLQLIKSYGAAAGVAYNPASDIGELQWILDDIDMVLQMTVNPGYGGQKFIEKMVDKVAKIRSITAKANHNIRIEVDGGINEDTIHDIVSAGADILVVGSALVGKDNFEQRADLLLQKAAED